VIEYLPKAMCKCAHSNFCHEDGGCKWVGYFGERCQCEHFFAVDGLRDSRFEWVMVKLPKPYVEWRAAKSGYSLPIEVFTAAVRACQEALAP
jgi:hypothetical protein